MMRQFLKLIDCKSLNVVQLNTRKTKRPVFPVGHRILQFPDNPRFLCSPNGEFNSLSSETVDTIGSASVPLDELKIKLKVSYCCDICNTRSIEKISKVAYNEGVVLVRCQGCTSTQLVADNLNWFVGKKKSIEDILGERGEKVVRIGSGENGDGEFILKA